MTSPLPLLVFNPSHDEALAAGYPYYYPSTVARRLALRWAALPALWHDGPAWVWLPDGAEQPDAAPWCSHVQFVRTRQLTPRFWQTQVQCIDCWGWDLLLRQQLLKAGAPASLLPDDASLSHISRLSSRESTPWLLRRMLDDARLSSLPLVGESVLVHSVSEFEAILQQWGGAVVKSLWSCSGRGVFRVGSQPTASDSGRVARLLCQQGAVELEPVQQGILDFGLEFVCQPARGVRYLGASLFETGRSGAWGGNVVAPQNVIVDRITRAIPSHGMWLDSVVEALTDALEDLLGSAYSGCLGIDLLVCRTLEGAALLPCVEMNLRRTMGHVALKLAERLECVDGLPPELRELWCPCPV